MMRPSRFVAALSLATLAVAGVACGDGETKKATLDGEELVGLFELRPGVCHSDGVTGSNFRMVQPGGAVGAGPYVINGDAQCGDNTTTLLAPGTDGGLRTGGYQAPAGSAFDAAGNGVAGLITKPSKFFAVDFALSTNEVDPQTKKKTGVPTIAVAGTTLTGDLSAFAAAWNGQFFNQGAPKPDSEVGEVGGTYDATTKAFTLEWASKIVGGPFNNFTGVWHLEGTFKAA